jgi:hypothetical protein
VSSSSTPVELQNKYAALTQRITALDHDIALEIDTERRIVAKERRDHLAREREDVAAEMMLIGVTPQVTASLEYRIAMLEKSVKKLWEIVKPGPRTKLARALIAGMFFTFWSLWMIKESRDWLIFHPMQAIVITLAFVVAMGIIAWLPGGDDHDQQ